jgi:hypothetical protein
VPEDIGAAAQAGSAAPTPQRFKPWVIVILILVLLCCFCTGLIGLLSAFGGPILKDLGLISAVLPVRIV